MIAKLKNFMTGAFTFRPAFNTSSNNSQEANDGSTAERIGPNRVILNARMNSVNDNATLGHITVGLSYREFVMSKPDEETAIVPIEYSDNDNQTDMQQRLLEKRATLNVKADTKYLTINFTGKHAKIIKSERIKIK
jgi:hypothetical protein